MAIVKRNWSDRDGGRAEVAGVGKTGGVTGRGVETGGVLSGRAVVVGGLDGVLVDVVVGVVPVLALLAAVEVDVAVVGGRTGPGDLTPAVILGRATDDPREVPLPLVAGAPSAARGKGIGRRTVERRG